jgi:hypothetical protein
MTMRIPGPLDQFRHPQNIQDGTLARQPSSPPGVLGFGDGIETTPIVQYGSKKQQPPSAVDHTRFGAGKRLYNEKWFEERFPNTLKAAHLHFAEIIYSWAIDPINKGEPEFKDNGRTMAEKTRVSISPKDAFDKPQSNYEAVKSLGRFIIDLETPLKIERNIMNGIHGIKWKGIMYIQDILGDSDAHWLLWPGIPKDMECTRGKWEIETDMTKMWDPIMQFRTWNDKIMKWSLDKPGPSPPYLTSPIYVKRRYFPSNVKI